MKDARTIKMLIKQGRDAAFAINNMHSAASSAGVNLSFDGTPDAIGGFDVLLGLVNAIEDVVDRALSEEMPKKLKTPTSATDSPTAPADPTCDGAPTGYALEP